MKLCNMEKIKINIPDNLSKEDEIKMITEQLGRKLLSTSNQKLIGRGYEINQLETQIIINREPTEKPIVTKECSVCNTVYDQTIGVSLWVNYGGSAKKRYYCSDNCREYILQIVGNGRASIKRSNLTFMTFNKS
jgi:hypothetical protein